MPQKNFPQTITYQGETRSIDEWAELKELDPRLIYYRNRKGWPVEEVLGPVRSLADRATHGQARKGQITKLYRCWQLVKNRCSNPKDKRWKRYGGRGIRLCDEWQDFATFQRYVQETFGYDDPPPGSSIDRINNDGNYEPGNIRFATAKEQANNRGERNRIIEYGGRSQTLGQWADETGIGFTTLAQRLDNMGWTIERALTTPTRIGKGVCWLKDKRKWKAYLGGKTLGLFKTEQEALAAREQALGLAV